MRISNYIVQPRLNKGTGLPNGKSYAFEFHSGHRLKVILYVIDKMSGIFFVEYSGFLVFFLELNRRGFFSKLDGNQNVLL